MRSEADVGEISNSGDKADKLDAAIIFALEQNKTLSYRRFQVSSTCHLSWIIRLIYMKNRFDQRFQVYINKYFDHIGQFSAIDQHSKACVFQWQLVGGRYYLRGVISNSYEFTYTNNNICGVVEAIFKEITAHPATNYLKEDGKAAELTVDRLRLLQKQLWNERVASIKTDFRREVDDQKVVAILECRAKNGGVSQEQFLEFLSDDFPIIPFPLPHRRNIEWTPYFKKTGLNSELYFSYGSNMDYSQMEKRVPNAEYVGIGRIVNHDIVFNRKGTYRPGGVASVISQDGADVFGVIWAVSPDVKKLDEAEDQSAYERVQKSVVLDEDREIACNVYITYPQGDIEPDQTYLDLIVASAAKVGLPQQWIDRLNRYKTSQK